MLAGTSVYADGSVTIKGAGAGFDGAMSVSVIA